MADVRINNLPEEMSPVASEVLAIDGATTRKATIQAIVYAGRPAASQAEAEAGSDANKAMTPLTTKQAIAAQSIPKSVYDPQNIQSDAFALANMTGTLSEPQLAADLIIRNAATRTALKAIDTTRTSLVYLKEEGREGTFKWTAGDYSAEITADTLEGIYIKADAIASTEGAWVRQAGWHVSGIDVRWFDAVLNSSSTDSGPAIQAAIDIGNLIKAKVYLPIGTLYTAQTLHVYAQSVLCGHGKSQSFLKLMDGEGTGNDGKGVLETYDFINLTGTETKFVTDPGMTWGFVLKGFTVDGNRENNYGGVSGDRFGGVGTAVWDGFGIRLYGRRYIVEDIGVHYCAGIGFYSECGNPSAPSPSDWYYDSMNDQQGHIKDVVVGNCSYDGFVFRGPGDIIIDDITTYLCNYPDETEYGYVRNSLMFSIANGNGTDEYISGMVWADLAVNTAVAGCEIGTIHTHTCKNGWGVRFQGDVFLRVRTDKLTSEGNIGQIKSRGAVIGQWSKVNTRNNNADEDAGDATLPDIDLESSQPLTIHEIESRSTTGNLGSIRVRVGSDNLNFGTVNIRGGTAGHGMVFDTNVDHCHVDKLIVTDLRGTASDGNSSRGLWTKSGATNIVIGIVDIRNNTVGWRNDSSSGDIVLAKGRIEANAVSYPGIVALDFNAALAVTSRRQCGFSTFDGTTTRFATFSGNASVDPASASEQTLTWTHNMWYTPNVNEVSWGYVTNGANRPTLQYAELIAPTSTQLSMRVKFSAAGNGTSGGSAFTAMV